jgi:hypothetical protein
MVQPLAPELLYTSPRAGYLPGELIVVEVHGPDGFSLGRHSFTIDRTVGSGFAGHVYQASPHQALRFPKSCQVAGSVVSQCPPQPDNDCVIAPSSVAIKVLRPRSRWKTLLRDSLFWLCFQAPFAPRLREESVRSGLAWQILLGAFTAPGAVARPYGYYWDASLCSYVEIHEWVDGRAAYYSPDEYLLARLLDRPHPSEDSEMARLKQFMDALTALCRRMGAAGLARQYEWYTLVSQANVLVRQTGSDSASEFTAVDCRPGLAIPFFMPISPAHARIILHGLRRGRLTHYDETDLGQLNKFLDTQPAAADEFAGLVSRLQQDEDAYRGSLPDLWHTRTRLLRDAAFRARVRTALLGDWIRTGLASTETSVALACRPVVFFGLWLLSLIPVLGSFLLRLVANSRYRSHLGRLWSSPAYRRLALSAWRERDLPIWTADGRIPSGREVGLAKSTAAYQAEKYLFSWLPSTAHRFLIDPAARARSLDGWVGQPIRLLTRHDARVAWLEGILQEQYEREMFPPEKAAALSSQVREPHMQGFIRDLGFCAGLDIFSRVVYLGLAAYGLTSGNFIPLGLAVLAPIPPSGPLRVLYVLIRLLADLPALLRIRQLPLENHPAGRLLMARLGALFIAPWRWIGNLFPLLEISTVYTRLSFVLVTYYAARAAGVIPIFGGQGKLLEYAVFQLCYNLPLSLKHEMDLLKK